MKLPNEHDTGITEIAEQRANAGEKGRLAVMTAATRIDLPKYACGCGGSILHKAL